MMVRIYTYKSIKPFRTVRICTCIHWLIRIHTRECTLIVVNLHRVRNYSYNCKLAAGANLPSLYVNTSLSHGMSS